MAEFTQILKQPLLFYCLRLYSNLKELELQYEIDLIKDKELTEEAVEIYSREP